MHIYDTCMESSIKTNKTKEVNTQHLGVTDIVDGMSYCVSKLLFFNVLRIMRQHLLQKNLKQLQIHAKIAAIEQFWNFNSTGAPTYKKKQCHEVYLPSVFVVTIPYGSPGLQRQKRKYSSFDHDFKFLEY